MAADRIDRLKSLHTRAIDSRNGYEEALTDAEGQGCTVLFQEMIAVHVTNAEELAVALRNAGEIADESGSFMTSINRTIMNVRSWFGGLGESVIPGMIDGEQRNVAAYADALEDGEFSEDDKILLTRQRERLQGEIQRLERSKTP